MTATRGQVPHTWQTQRFWMSRSGYMQHDYSDTRKNSLLSTLSKVKHCVDKNLALSNALCLPPADIESVVGKLSNMHSCYTILHCYNAQPRRPESMHYLSMLLSPWHDNSCKYRFLNQSKDTRRQGNWGLSTWRRCQRSDCRAPAPWHVTPMQDTCLHAVCA
jgi:hypothetical protein